mmetsp:Transcript_39038/g.54441  ORF Transcript_39038/g.54441 Transcript_39038/m.54441 type:complete len:96 (+) Transcript_39038:167-454(+)
MGRKKTKQIKVNPTPKEPSTGGWEGLLAPGTPTSILISLSLLLIVMAFSSFALILAGHGGDISIHIFIFLGILCCLSASLYWAVHEGIDLHPKQN